METASRSKTQGREMLEDKSTWWVFWGHIDSELNGLEGRAVNLEISSSIHHIIIHIILRMSH